MRSASDPFSMSATSDYMYGGAGRDTFWAQDSHSDYIDGGADSDILASSDGGGVDTILNVP
jgi:hypothetical protein